MTVEPAQLAERGQVPEMERIIGFAFPRPPPDARTRASGENAREFVELSSPSIRPTSRPEFISQSRIARSFFRFRRSLSVLRPPVARMRPSGEIARAESCWAVVATVPSNLPLAASQARTSWKSLAMMAAPSGVNPAGI